MEKRRLFINGEVITVNKDDDIAQAMAIQGEKILAVGSTQDVLALKNDHTEVMDLKGRTLMPGLIDAHLHISMYGTNTLSVSCKADHIVSIADLLEDLKKQKEKTPKGRWSVGVS